MVEVKITYETLFDFLRREKNRSELQQIEPTFYKDVVEYLTEKKSTLREEETHSPLHSKTEQEKIKIQIKNIQKILRELYELREKKVINLAMNKVRTESNLVDTSNLLPEEISLFNDACQLMTKYKEGVLHKILLTELPSVISSSAVDYTHKITKQEIIAENEMNKKSKEDIFDAYKRKLDEAREKTEDKEHLVKTFSSHSETQQRVKILNDLPKFMGQDKNIYGPFKKDDLVELPESIVNILLKKSRVEII
jgi:DNA replication initiation complex subunit (GINS family)